jgi:hypothetical protein
MIKIFIGLCTLLGAIAIIALGCIYIWDQNKKR